METNMRKKKSVRIEYLVDGEQSSLLDIVEQNSDSQVWKSYLEKENHKKYGLRFLQRS